MLENIIRSFRRTVAVAGLSLGLQGCGDTINNYYFGQDGGSNAVQTDSSVQNDSSSNDGYISSDVSPDGGLADAAPDGNLADAQTPDSGNDASVEAGPDAMLAMLDGSYDVANDGSPDGPSCIQQLYFQDNDEDGYGNVDEFAFFCEGQQPNNYTPVPGDCDDSNASAWLWYPAYHDNDGDSFGSGELTLACVGSSAMSGYSLNNLDCDDENNAIHPFATDICDGLDNDCYTLSADGSGEFAPLNTKQVGVCAGSQKSCVDGQWQNDYSSVASYEEGIEVTCDYFDNNCNGPADEGGLQQLFYQDADGDGYGTPYAITSQCPDIFPAQGWVSNFGDCNDNNANINPDAQELCDNINNNCVNGKDEGFNLDEECYVGIGECEEEGEYECSDDGLSTICDEEPGQPRYDLCACQDNDCDGEIDCQDLEGRIVFTLITNTSFSDRDIYVMDADGCNLVNLTNYPGADDYYPAFSPDGMKIAFVSTRDGNDEIYVMNADGSNLQNVTNDPSYERNPQWSSDGTKIIHNRNWNEIYVMNADGSNVQKISYIDSSYNYSAYGTEPVYSPDGLKIAYTKRVANTDNAYSDEIYTMDSDGGNEINLTNNSSADEHSPLWSSDGTKIVFVSDRDGNEEIYVMNMDGSNQTNLTNNPAEDSPYYRIHSWSPNDSKITFKRGKNLWVMDNDGTNQRKVTNFSEDDDSATYVGWEGVSWSF